VDEQSLFAVSCCAYKIQKNRRNADKRTSTKEVAYLKCSKQTTNAHENITSSARVMLNDGITLVAHWHWRDAAKVVSPFIIMSVFDLPCRSYKL